MIDIGPFTTDGSGNILFGNSDASIRIGSGPGSKAEVISILGGIGDAASDANLATLVQAPGPVDRQGRGYRLLVEPI